MLELLLGEGGEIKILLGEVGESSGCDAALPGPAASPALSSASSALTRASACWIAASVAAVGTVFSRLSATGDLALRMSPQMGDSMGDSKGSTLPFSSAVVVSLVSLSSCFLTCVHGDETYEDGTVDPAAHRAMIEPP